MTTTKTASPLVTYETVAQACESLTAEGKRPSVRGITAFLGGGSPNVILDYQRQWKAGRPVVKAAEIQVDPRIGQIVAEQIAQAVATARADIEVQLSEAEQDAEMVSKAGREAEDRAKALADELEAAKGQVQGLTGQIEQLKADAEQVKADAAEKVKAAEERANVGIAKAEEEATRERDARETAQVSLAKAELRLEALPRLEADLAAVRAELGAERQARIAAEQTGAVLQAQKADLEAHLGETKARADRLTEQLNTSHERTEQLGRELADARVAVQAGLARLEAAAREIEDAKKSVNEARDQARIAGEQAAELRGQLAGKTVAKEPAKPTAKAKTTKPAAKE